jgi:WD40 repeat protein
VVAFSPDDRQLAVGDTTNGSIVLWNLATDEESVVRRGGPGFNVTALVWSNDGKTLVSGDDSNSVILWDAEKRAERMRLPGHKFWICSVAYLPSDDSTLVTRCQDHTLRIWQMPEGTLKRTIDIPAHFSSPVTFSADGALLACVGSNNVIQIRETSNWEIVEKAVGHTSHVKSVTFSPDGNTLASASDDGTIRLWEVATGEERCVLRGHQGEVECVRFTPDGRTLVSSGQDGTVRVWRTAD